jgi:hypothetical protein
MKSVEWDGRQWCLVQWEDKGFLTRVGKIIAPLKSRDKVDAETEAMLQGWL